MAFANGPPLDFPIRAQDRTAATFAKVKARGQKLSKFFSRGLFAGGAIAAASFLNPLGSVNDALAEFDALGKRIRTSGFSSDFFQGLGLAASEASIDTEKFSSAMLKFVGILGEAKTGRGQFVETLRQSHPELVKEIQAAKDSDTAFRALADAVANAQSADEKALLTKAAFGNRMLDLVRVLNLGSKGLDDTTEKARELGLVIGGDLLDNAEELQNQFGIATDRINLGFKKALINLSPAIVGTVQGIASISSGIGGLVTNIGEFFAKMRAEKSIVFNDRNFLGPEGLPKFDPNEFIIPEPTITKETKAVVEWKKEVKDASDTLKVAKTSAIDFGGALADTFDRAIFEGGKLSDILKDIARSFLRSGISSLGDKLFAGFSFGGSVQSGIGSSLAASTTIKPPGFATGGSFRVGGSGGRDKPVTVGLKAGEIVDVHKGEPKRGGDTNVQVNVFAPPGSSVERKERQSGDLRVIDLIISTVNDGFGKGKFDKTAGPRFGLQTATARR